MSKKLSWLDRLIIKIAAAISASHGRVGFKPEMLKLADTFEAINSRSDRSDG